MGEIAEKLASETEPLVDLKGTIYVGVIDEAFPADCRAWFLRQKGRGIVRRKFALRRTESPR